jgi:hypothetical protein
MSFHTNCQIILGRWLKPESTLKLKNIDNTDEGATSSNGKRTLSHQSERKGITVINIIFWTYIH